MTTGGDAAHKWRKRKALTKCATCAPYHMRADCGAFVGFDERKTARRPCAHAADKQASAERLPAVTSTLNVDSETAEKLLMGNKWARGSRGPPQATNEQTGERSPGRARAPRLANTGRPCALSSRLLAGAFRSPCVGSTQAPPPRSAAVRRGLASVRTKETKGAEPERPPAFCVVSSCLD